MTWRARILALAMLLLLGWGGARIVLRPVARPEGGLRGDADGNGRVDGEDVRLLLHFLVTDRPPDAPPPGAHLDLDRDGMPGTLADAVVLSRLVRGEGR
ncbi:MAG: hypothetical protein HY608_09785 [Planctomycetes bacterium]|nr:hypothetical protein [Planctomycetota bacterium]